MCLTSLEILSGLQYLLIHSVQPKEKLEIMLQQNNAYDQNVELVICFAPRKYLFMK